MDLQKVLGFPLDQVRIDPDGTSTPPEVSPLSPPTKPGVKADPRRLLEATRIEGLAPPPPPPAPGPALAPVAAPAPEVPAAAADPAAVPDAAPGAAPAPAAATPAAAAGRAALWWAQLRRRTGGASPGPRSTERWILIAASSALIGFGATLLVALLVRGAPPGPTEARAAKDARSAPAAAPENLVAPLLEPCVRQREAQLVVRGVAANFALEARARPAGVGVLLGLSLGGGTALGLELNATTLVARESLRDSGARELLGVVPAPGGGAPEFSVDRASVGGFREWRSLPDLPEWALTRTNRALNLTERSTQRSSVLWPLGAEEEVSRPRLEWQDSERLALVLRRGGRQGKLMIAWFDPRTQQHSALRQLPFDAGELGLPSLATQGNLALVAAAARDSGKAPWHVELASSERQGHTRRIEVRAVSAASDRESFAPSLAALSGARWFLQWTEGQQGLRRVRGLTLDAAFAPLGEPILLSAPGASAGGGSIVAVDEGLLSLFLLQRGSSYELWAATLSCR